MALVKDNALYLLVLAQTHSLVLAQMHPKRGDVVPRLAIVGLLLGHSSECLQGLSEALILEVAEAQGKPCLWM